MSPVDITAIIIAVIGSGSSGVFVSWMLGRIDCRDDPLHEGVRELLFCKLEDLHAQMVADNGICDVGTKQTAERIYTAYHQLGGNGVGKQMIEEIREAHIAKD